MEANEDYWATVPSFQRLVVREIGDGAARLVQVQSGEVDIANVDSRLIGEAEAAGLTIQAVKDIATVQVILGGMYFGGEELDGDAPWIQADNPEQGLAIREALSLAIDRQLILDAILRGEGTLNYGPLLSYPANPELTDPSWTLPEYDLDLAREKLAEGGYPDGFPVEMFLYADDVDTVALGQAIADMWTELGLDVQQTLSEEDILDEALNIPDTDGMAWVKMQGNDPPDVILANYLSTNPDDHKLWHPAMNEGFAALQAEPDPDVRFAIQRDIIEELRNEMIMIPLFTANLPFVLGPEVGTWDPTPGIKDMSDLHTVTPAD